MNKYKLVFFLFGLIVVFSFIMVLFSGESDEVKYFFDELAYQNDTISYYESYLYTIDNPKIVVDPFKKNYNTALIIFETSDYVSIDVFVNGMSFTTDVTNRHYIVLYDLDISGNDIKLRYNGKIYDIVIDIDEGISDIDFNLAYLLNNNHFIVATDKYLDNLYYTGFMEVDITGKIYYEYIIECGYNNIITEFDSDKYAIYVDNYIVIIDRQNGNIIKKIEVDSKNSFYAIDYVDNLFVLYGEEGNISVSYDGVIYEDVSYSYNKRYFSGDANYINSKGVRFSYEMENEKSNKNIWLLSYKKLDRDILIEREFNRVVVSGDDISGGYIIFDKLFDKRVYVLKDDINYIYTSGFSGNYSIYYMFDDVVYKSDNAISF